MYVQFFARGTTSFVQETTRDRFLCCLYTGASVVAIESEIQGNSASCLCFSRIGCCPTKLPGAWRIERCQTGRVTGGAANRRRGRWKRQEISPAVFPRRGERRTVRMPRGTIWLCNCDEGTNWIPVRTRPCIRFLRPFQINWKCG